MCNICDTTKHIPRIFKVHVHYENLAQPFINRLNSLIDYTAYTISLIFEDHLGKLQNEQLSSL